MSLFATGHATHPQWRMACELTLAQLRAQLAQPGHAHAPTLGLLYLTDRLAAHAADILARLREALPQVRDWAGTVGVGVCASGAEYLDEPALAVMLCALPRAQVRVFSGRAPLATAGFRPATALVHADADTPDLPELITELATGTTSGGVFGGLAASRGEVLQFAVSGAAANAADDGVLRGGLSGVAFGPAVPLITLVTQGCRPLGAEHTLTTADGNLLLTLDGEPALDVLLRELGLPTALAGGVAPPPQVLAALRQTLAGLLAGPDERMRQRGQLGPDVVVRHLVGIDRARRAVALAERPAPGQRLVFCQRNAQAARADLMRICAEIREELEAEALPQGTLSTPVAGGAPAPGGRSVPRIRGAIYVSCASRGGPHFGGPGAELQLIEHALGEVPLVGFFAGGEIAQHRLYGYTGVLTVFVDDGLVLD